MTISRLRPSSAWGLVVLGALASALSSCGGNSSGSSSPTPQAVSLPARVSAVPVDSSALQTAIQPNVRLALGQAASQLLLNAGPSFQAPGTDYSNAQPSRTLIEPTLDQFDLLSSLLNVIAQTHYHSTVNQGPYQASVDWQTDLLDTQGMAVQLLTVDSQFVEDGNGNPALQVDIWVQAPAGVVADKAQFLLYTAPSVAADGSYLNLGEWTLNVQDGSDQPVFAAQASILEPSGETVLSFNDALPGSGPRQGVVYQAQNNGYGKMSYPSWSFGTGPIQQTTSYVYNPGQLLLHQLIPDTLTYKDRTAPVGITTRYGLYDGSSGADVMSTHTFGFPVSFSDGAGAHYGYYYASNGGHHLVSDLSAGVVPNGTVVTRTDQGPNGPTYQTTSFAGQLTQWSRVPGQLGDLLNIITGVWDSFETTLTWNAAQGQWLENGVPYPDLASLEPDANRYVWVNGPAGIGSLVYQPANPPSAAGFYLTSTSTLYVPKDQDQVSVYSAGTIYLEYQGATAGWVEKTVLGFDPTFHLPTFDPNGDVPYVLELNRLYRFDSQGAEMTVQRTGSGPDVYDVELQIATVANPVNAASLAGQAASFQPSWVYPNTTPSTYQFGTDPTRPGFMQMQYQSLGTYDQLFSAFIPAIQANSALAQNSSGLVAYNAQGQPLPGRYDWTYPSPEYPASGIQTYLQDNGTWKILDATIQFAPLPLTVNGQSRTLYLGYDGWLSGIPYFYWDLAINNNLMTDALASEIITIPDGTLLTDQLNAAQSYAIKSLDILEYLKVASTPDTTLDISSADALNLDDPELIPPLVSNGMGGLPANAPLKYSGGRLVPTD